MNDHAPNAGYDAGEIFSPDCHEPKVEGPLTSYRPYTDGSVETDGNQAERRGSEGHDEHGQGDGAERGQADVPEVWEEIGSEVPQRRPDVRDGLPMAGLRLRGDDDPGVVSPTPAAREVWDDSAAPGGYVCSVCGMPSESEPCEHLTSVLTPADGGTNEHA
jgi:hypothetical protein